MHFKVGDRVRVVERHDHDEDWVHVGAEFRVMYVSAFNRDRPVKVAGPGGDWDYLATEQLEHASAENFQQQVYKLQVPEEPAGVTRVRPVGKSTVWSRKGVMWEDPSGFTQRWFDLLRRFPEGVEPVSEASDFEVSLDYLRRNAHVLDGLEASGVTGSHAAAVVRKVIAESERGVLAKEGSE